MGVRSFLVVFSLAALLNGGSGSRSALLDNRIIQALESFREHIATGWPEAEIPSLDPAELPLTDLAESVDNIAAYGQLTSLTASKMSKFTTSYVESDVLFLRATIELNLPLLEVTGNRYALGAFSAEVRDVVVGIGVTFAMSEEERIFEVDTVKVLFDCYDPSLEDDWGDKDTLLTFLKLTYQPYFDEALKYEINTAIQGGGNDDDFDEEDPIDDFFDRLLADLRQLILEDHLDPMYLPEDSDEFTVSLYNTTVDGALSISNGALKGLSTVHRAGNMSVRVIGIKAEIIWDGEIGFDDLEVDVSFGLELPIFGKDLSYSLKMSYVHLSFETDIFLVRENITLARCDIAELGPIHYKEKGAGPLDTSLYNLLANTLLGGLHNYVMKIGGEVVCNLLEKVLSHI